MGIRAAFLFFRGVRCYGFQRLPTGAGRRICGSQGNRGDPDLHREQIQQVLKQYFGTPSSPWQRELAPAEESADTSAETSGESSADEGGESSKAAPPAAPAMVDLIDPLRLQHRAEVYRARCAGCHRTVGRWGRGSREYLQPKPRNYHPGVFKFTSTPYGRKPARQDLVRTIRRGAKGTSMPAFPWMSQEDLNAVIDYVMVLSERGELEKYMARTAAEYDEEETIEQAVFDEGLDFIRNSWADAENMIVHPVTAEPEIQRRVDYRRAPGVPGQGLLQVSRTRRQGTDRMAQPRRVGSTGEGERQDQYGRVGAPRPRGGSDGSPPARRSAPD